MTETVVHVTTLEQWKSVLDVWFKQGYEWVSGGKEYKEIYFTKENSRYLDLWIKDISKMSISVPSKYIEYSEFMAQQKEDNKMETYYVTKEQLDLIKELKNLPAPLVAIMNKKYGIETLYNELSSQEEKALLRYLGGDETIEFKAKEQLYWLYLVDVLGQRNYFTISNATALPDRTVVKEKAFVETLKEIKKWQTPAWEIEKVGE
ncbi:hypothetical protein [Leuconostoc mesenteroides]|uniref:hypothetical protein n=1 Tax=Leuconostoc mesenteroides TaxID=1245 RepID=UPI00235FF610|nr:hypothetical protein [Leuconostoc mesenteroides]